ncbi:hypothetical protein POJ06DRAFT_286894 [Lipomyces tetrasporus]|uniref:Uncharacterized protein n=1 Tax=Lipomyces tetrasporus TaxID=54092 RepID=A0AAD7QK24_9ASCO|nr:uncharacterized protein POJ06DRAFT_286894 [Lipomyces tetrasporus]KAJ8096631.1 hypothetical protein POJ06DRAFT_286894 [Lipomyces tetrasporus]
MKFSLPIAAAVIALVPVTEAWRVYFYQLQNEEGPFITDGGPGNPGHRCFSNVDPLNQKISSMRYYSDNDQLNTRCCLTLYDSPGCENSRFSFCRNQFVNFNEVGFDNDVSSYSTDCYHPVLDA